MDLEKYITRLLHRLKRQGKIIDYFYGSTYYFISGLNTDFTLYTDSHPHMMRIEVTKGLMIPSDKKDLMDYLIQSLCESIPYKARLYYYAESDTYEVSARFHIHFAHRYEEDMSYLCLILDGLAELQNDIVNQYNKHRDDVLNPLKESQRFSERNAYLASTLEHRTMDARCQFRPNQTSPLILGQLLISLNERWACRDIRKMKIVTDELSVLTHSKDILHYPILSPLLQGQGPATKLKARDVTYILYLRDETVVITIRAERENPFTIYFRLVCESTLAQVLSMQSLQITGEASFSFLIAYDKSTESQAEAELDYMIEEARHCDPTILTPDSPQQFFQSFLDKNFNSLLYWGVKCVSQERYYEGLLKLENAFLYLQQRKHLISDPSQLCIYYICYNLGICCCKLKLWQKAIYYQQVLFDSPLIHHRRSYITTLVTLGDIEAFDTVLFVFKHAFKVYDGEEEMPSFWDEDSLCDYLDFLYQCVVVLHIKRHEFDEARELLKKLKEDIDKLDFYNKHMTLIRKLEREERKKGASNDENWLT